MHTINLACSIFFFVSLLFFGLVPIPSISNQRLTNDVVLAGDGNEIRCFRGDISLVEFFSLQNEEGDRVINET